MAKPEQPAGGEDVAVRSSLTSADWHWVTRGLSKRKRPLVDERVANAQQDREEGLCNYNNNVYLKTRTLICVSLSSADRGGKATA